MRASSSAACAYGSPLACGKSMRTTLYGEAASSVGPLLGVDHVVRRRDDGLQAAGALRVVVQGGEGLDVGHGSG